MNNEEISLLVRTLRNISFFSACSASDVDALLYKFRKLKISGGKTIIKQKKKGKAFYVISRGRVAVLKRKGFFNKLIKTLGEGNYFGEISLISNEKTTATIKAIRDTDMFVLTKDDFQEILEHNLSLSKKILSIASQRRRESEIKSGIK